MATPTAPPPPTKPAPSGPVPVKHNVVIGTPRSPLAPICTNTKRQLIPADPISLKRKPAIHPDVLAGFFDKINFDDPPAKRRCGDTKDTDNDCDGAECTTITTTTTTKSIPIRDTRTYSPLESIPLELFDKITSHLSGRDFLRLRLTNKSIEKLVRSRATRSVTVDVISSLSPAIHYAARHTSEVFANVREITLNTHASFLAHYGQFFKPLLEAHDCQVLYYISEMHNLKKIEFGNPSSASSFQIHDINYMNFVRNCFEALFHSGIDCKGEEWYTRFLNVSSLSVVLPLDKRYKHPVTLLQLLPRLEKFAFNVYPNSYSAYDFRHSRMFIYLQEGFLSYLSDQLRELSIGFPSRTPGELSLSVPALCNLRNLSITNYIVTSRKCIFPDILQLSSLTHLTLNAHIEVSWTGPSSNNLWSLFYKALISKSSLQYYENTAILQGTGYAFKYNKVGYVDILSWESDPTALRGDWDRVFRARRVYEARKVVNADRAAYALLQETLEKKKGQEGRTKKH